MKTRPHFFSSQVIPAMFAVLAGVTIPVAVAQSQCLQWLNEHQADTSQTSRTHANDDGSVLNNPEYRGLRMATLQSLQARASEEHHVNANGGHYTACSNEEQVVGQFDELGAHVSSAKDSAVSGRLHLHRIGRDGAKELVNKASPVAGDYAVMWDRGVGKGAVQEVWQAGPLGLEHKVFVQQRPEGNGPVELEVQVDGLVAQQNSQGIALTRKGHAARLAMKEYYVRDSQGKLLEGTMAVRDGSVVYSYSDIGAVYPVEIDPLVVTNETRITAEEPIDNSFFGIATAISADGNTALIGASGYANNGVAAGAAMVFTRTSGVWAQQKLLVAPDPAEYDAFGLAVALSGDGNTALVGAPSHDDTNTSDNGKVYAFVRTGDVWADQGALLASDKSDGASFGTSISLSADGNTALIGSPRGPGVGAADGAAYVFVRASDTWTEQSILVDEQGDGANAYEFGTSVALSPDGNTALVGAPYSAGDAGAGYVFARTGETWAQETKFTATDGTTGAGLGYAVSLSADSNTAALSSISFFNFNGGCAVFTKDAGTWGEPQILSLSVQQDFLASGNSLALSPDGNSLFIAAASLSVAPLSYNGAVFLFARSEGVWTEQSMITASDGAEFDGFGAPISLSADNSTLAISAYSKNAGGAYDGAVYFYDLFQTNGDACSNNAQCQSGFCADGVCCDSACDAGACDACSVAAGASTDGTCELLTGPVCDDGDACTRTDTCNEGVCTGGDPVTCSAPNECSTDGTCDSATGECSFGDQPDGTACEGGKCEGGACVQASGGAGGTGGTGGAGGSTGGTGGSGATPAAPPPEDDSGCSISSRPHSQGAFLFGSLLALGMLMTRTRRSRS